MDSTIGTVCGVPNCRINRCGYTGEDGFEISVPSDRAETIAESLVDHDRVKLAGLGARDTLRYLDFKISIIVGNISNENNIEFSDLNVICKRNFFFYIGTGT